MSNLWHRSICVTCVCRHVPRSKPTRRCVKVVICVSLSAAECGVVCFSLPAGLPDPFAKVVVDGSGQCHSTDTVRNTLDPKWNQHYDLWVRQIFFDTSLSFSLWHLCSDSFSVYLNTSHLPKDLIWLQTAVWGPCSGCLAAFMPPFFFFLL